MSESNHGIDRKAGRTLSSKLRVKEIGREIRWNVLEYPVFVRRTEGCHHLGGRSPC